MHQDVVDLRSFYDTALGQMARRMIRRRLRLLWPDVQGLTLLGLGFATPYLGMFRAEADRTLAAMPARQGVIHWPSDGPSLVTLADETELPFPDMSIDRVLLVHHLEVTESLRPLMREIWRVLAGGGRLLAIVPNRRGIWSRIDNNPFGHGRPYSSGQLSQMLRDNLFVPEQVGRALYAPPMRSRVLLGSALAWEQVGWRWFERFSGVLMVEASKQIYQIPTAVRPERRRRPILVPMPGRAATVGRERREEPSRARR